ncbi:MAG TPA: DinB family protein [Gemmatimonadaceae bacterium]|nr:DinB family protein [Gemmatimonadaceae bacterium]
MAEYAAADMARSFRTVRNNTLQIAEEIPEDKYDFVAAPGTRSVRDLLAHIAYANQLHFEVHRDQRRPSLQGYDFGAYMQRVAAAETKPQTKSEVISALREEGEKFAAWIETLPKEFLNETMTNPMGEHPKTRMEYLMAVKEHEMHHRAQLMLIERMLGITPHLTRAMQERRARAQQAAKA